MQSSSLQQALIEEYHQFLGDLGQTICDRISTDQGLQALKQMQQKEYLFIRIKQIIEAVYHIKNQQQVSKLFCEIQQQKLLIMDQDTEIKKLSKLKNSNHIHSQQSHLHSDKNINSQLQKQNWELQKQLITQDQQNKLRLKEISQTIKILQKEKNSTKQTFQSKIQLAIENIKAWEEKYKALYQQKIVLESSIEQEIEKYLNEQMKTRQLQQKNQELELNAEKTKIIHKSLKQKNDALQEKLMRLQKNNQRLQQQIKTYQQQIQIIKKVHQELIQRKNNESTKNCFKSKVIGQQQALSVQNLKTLQEEHLRFETQQKNRKLFQLDKKCYKLREQKHQLQTQYHEYKLKIEKQKFFLEQQLSECKIKTQKQSRLAKEEYMKQREIIVKRHNDEVKSIKDDLTKRYQSQLLAIQKSLSSYKSQLQKLQSQTKKSQTYLQQKQLHFKQSSLSLQSKNQSLLSNIKQLQKSLQDKSMTQKDYVKEISQKVYVCQQEVREYRIQNEKLRNQLQNARKQTQKITIQLVQYKNTESNKKNEQKRIQKYEKKDWQYNKQLQIQMRQKIHQLQTELKYLKKQHKEKCDKFEQLKLFNSRLQQKFNKTQQILIQTQKSLETQKRCASEIKATHQKQIQKLQQSHQFIIQSQKQSIKKQYEHLLNDRQQRLEEVRLTAKNLEREMQFKKLRGNLDQQKDKVRELSSKIHRMELLTKDLRMEIKEKQTKLLQQSQVMKIMENQLIFLRNQNSLISKQGKEQIRSYQMFFKQFKIQVDLYLRKQLGKIRELGKVVIKLINQMKGWFTQTKQTSYMEFYSYLTKYEAQNSQSIKSLKSYYQRDVSTSYKLNIQQIKQEYDQSTKQFKIEQMSVLAGLQLQLGQLQETLSLKIRQNQQLSKQLLQKKQQLLVSKQQASMLKQVNLKLSQKQVKLQKFRIQNERDISILTRELDDAKQKIRQQQKMYQQRLQRCRQKYVQENEKLFTKYQKQFDKLISMNTRVKNVTLNNLMLGNIVNNSIVPTKQTVSLKQSKEQKQSSRLDHLKKQILLTKQKLQNYNDKNTKTKILNSKLTKQKSPSPTRHFNATIKYK